MARRKDEEEACACLTARGSSGFDCNVPFAAAIANSHERLPRLQLSVLAKHACITLFHFHRPSFTSIPALIPPTSSAHPTRAVHCTAVHVPGAFQFTACLGAALSIPDMVSPLRLHLQAARKLSLLRPPLRQWKKLFNSHAHPPWVDNLHGAHAGCQSKRPSVFQAPTRGLDQSERPTAEPKMVRVLFCSFFMLTDRRTLGDPHLQDITARCVAMQVAGPTILDGFKCTASAPESPSKIASALPAAPHPDDFVQTVQRLSSRSMSTRTSASEPCVRTYEASPRLRLPVSAPLVITRTELLHISSRQQITRAPARGD